MRGVYTPRFAPHVGSLVGSFVDDAAALKHQIEQGAQASVERTVKVRGAILIAGAIAAVGLAFVLSKVADS